MKACLYCSKKLTTRSQAKYCNSTCANKARGIDPSKTEYERIRFNGKMMPLHKVIWIKANGAVPSGYIVHHKNGNKLDNRLENLEILTAQQHAEHHNQKWPREKTCVICGIAFVPKPTKRKIAQTCGWNCGRKLAAQKSMAYAFSKLSEGVIE